MLRLLAKDIAKTKTKSWPKNFAMTRLENMLMFADITIEYKWSTEESYFVLTATFPCGDFVWDTGASLQDAIQNLDNQMRIYVNNC